MFKVTLRDYGVTRIKCTTCTRTCSTYLVCAVGTSISLAICKDIDHVALAEFLQMLVRCPSGTGPNTGEKREEEKP